MRSRKSIIALLTTATLAMLFGTAPIPVNASNNASNVASKQVKKHYVIKNTPKLSKWGYILNVNSSALPIFVGRSNYRKLLNNPYFKGAKSISPKKLKMLSLRLLK